MANNNQNGKSKHNFWHLFIILVVAAITGGVIYFYAIGNMQQDDLNSLAFWAPHKQAPVATTSHKAPVKKTVTK